MFLICNGILAFLAKSSLSCNSSSSSPSVFVNAGGDHDEFSLSASEMSQMKEPVLVDEEVIIIPVTRSGGGANEDISSTDELNRKIEEFIRKMKEEIRIEAQQQLITVE
ncbi:hypothetical protein JRO89_XSUnG0026700 [Xanthoceras sorbifolium]|uniref:Uncharacterized protein n=1 Tax=Xanthoceras sorbifolium TaxID=99658 RepID=A0ABQ8H050_9ROSI|nr:hypothetical protein JRO89_XSUnG0026700 [Xanthoceras sorbifolium]